MHASLSKTRVAIVSCFLLCACSGHGDDSAGSSGGQATVMGGTGTGASSGGSGNGGATNSRGGYSGAGQPASASGAPGAGGALPGGGATTNIGGAFPNMVPPPAAADGSSPYLRACHGDTASCVDVANLRCLGIRDGTQVNGYSCSNPCATDSDCSSAPTGVPATPACVDFVNQKHCLLVCSSNGEKRACPTGMTCYVYPGSPIGYCLWP